MPSSCFILICGLLCLQADWMRTYDIIPGLGWSVKGVKG